MKLKKIFTIILIMIALLGGKISFADSSVNFPVYAEAAILLDSSSRKSFI